jgi:hypothetical protein
MIRALITKDLYLATRDRAFRFALCGYLLIYLVACGFFFSSFLAATNYPFAAISALLFSRISVFQGVILAALTPWLILRMQEQQPDGQWMPQGAAMLAPPWKIILARVIASAIYLGTLTVLSLPVLCLARLMGAATFLQIGWALMDVFLFLLVVTLLVLHLRLRFRSWLSSWILSYAVLGIAGLAWYKIWSLAGRASCSLIFLLLLIFFAALLFPHGNRALLYEKN